MRKFLFCFLIFICIKANAQEDTTYYYGANNRLANSSDAVVMHRVTHPAKKKYKIFTYTRQDDSWEMFSSTAVKIRSENKFLVREYRTGNIEKIYVRQYTETSDGMFDFTESWKGKFFRSGTSSTRIPLTLEGKEVRYFDSGQKKSESVYVNNRMISNTNWLENGDEYISNVFYSVDEYPEYKAGTRMLHKYLSEYIAQSGFNTDNLDGSINLGLVITDKGNIDGVYVLSGIMPGFDEIAAEAIKSIPGEWESAVLDNKAVNCFLTFPINFYREQTRGFDNMELTFSNYTWMLYW